MQINKLCLRITIFLHYFCSMNTSILSPTNFDETHNEAECRLMGQLTTRDITFTVEDYRALVTSPHSHLFLLQYEDKVVGMLTLGEYLSPTGSKAWIEDVVVDEACRGYGFGRLLVAHTIDYSKARGIDTVYLTSNPKRVAANGLYQSMEFVRKETNMYKLDLKK